jgi:hypothetical protein
MKLGIHSFSLAGALTTSLWYGTIAYLVKIWPYETLKFISVAYMIPRLENIIPYIKITPTEILTGISIHFITSYFFFCLLASFYNLFSSFKNK